MFPKCHTFFVLKHANGACLQPAESLRLCIKGEEKRPERDQDAFVARQHVSSVLSLRSLRARTPRLCGGPASRLGAARARFVGCALRFTCEQAARRATSRTPWLCAVACRGR
ncbi:hypothetical protein MHYP_G00131750 [Metynnis hypsauchen]